MRFGMCRQLVDASLAASDILRSHLTSRQTPGRHASFPCFVGSILQSFFFCHSESPYAEPPYTLCQLLQNRLLTS